VLCSWESPFADCLSGAPGGDYLSRAIVDCRGAPTADTAFMGLTSCRWITIAGTLARRRRGAQPAGRMPVAVSLSNAPPSATPSSVMSLFCVQIRIFCALEHIRRQLHQGHADSFWLRDITAVVTLCMIARIWPRWAPQATADDYQRHYESEVSSHLQGVDGFRGAKRTGRRSCSPQSRFFRWMLSGALPARTMSRPSSEEGFSP
jgi:hypothetical protein